MKILSLFDGISCARVSLERAEIPVEIYYASEIDKYAILVSKKNYPDIIQLGNVVGLIPPKVDLLIGGSPCQDLSIAKKNREGLNGERSGLFWEYVRILNEIKPKFFILENVNSMPKEAKEVITKALNVEPIMINASLVSAQNRKRLFWVGVLNGNKYEQLFIQQPKDLGILLKDILEDNPDIAPIKSKSLRISGRSSGINDRHNWDTILVGNVNPSGKGMNGCVYSEDGKAPTLTTNKGECSKILRIGQIGKGCQAERIYDPEGKSTALNSNGGGSGAKTGRYLVKGVASRTYPRQPTVERAKQLEIRKDYKSNSMTSVSTDSMVSINEVVRKLTPIECERLQSLPDNYTEGISNSQRYKCLGNAFNVDVVSHILRVVARNE